VCVVAQHGGVILELLLVGDVADGAVGDPDVDVKGVSVIHGPAGLHAGGSPYTSVGVYRHRIIILG